MSDLYLFIKAIFNGMGEILVACGEMERGEWFKLEVFIHVGRIRYVLDKKPKHVSGRWVCVKIYSCSEVLWE